MRREPTPDPTLPDRHAPLVARNPQDIAAAVPVALGFEPDDSVVMLTIGGRDGFHARVDFPPAAAADDEVIDLLMAPALTHEVEAVLFVHYAADARAVRRLARRLEREFRAARVRVIVQLRVTDQRCYAALGRLPGVTAHGLPLDVRSHAFRAASVLHGRVTLGSRAEVAATVAPDVPSQRAVEALPMPIPCTAPGLRLRLCELLSDETTVRLDDAEVARMAHSLVDPRIRDEALLLVSRDTADRHVALWSDVVRRAPEHLVPDVAAVLALAAWVAGHGALAWCAVERCREVAPDHRLAGYVAAALENALPPRVWDERVG
ncbi:DUF4192 domain-containing protein [Nocardioides acrostichi]|uniref:DUF4192 domain-containing protein n=1 Tax=Nocardioides acrostichi TaxID=2784339 RepID=A0A930V0E6_9ACTN|nr:DUF4192 domain-containing protein [Nocardioides acrostichi]MBF4160939.1 DUF4192 domain-containing protein [Nocardioides acrostichi]